jgi:hypothetical protein
MRASAPLARDPCSCLRWKRRCHGERRASGLLRRSFRPWPGSDAVGCTSVQVRPWRQLAFDVLAHEVRDGSRDVDPVLRPLIAHSPHAATAGTATHAERRRKLDGAVGRRRVTAEAEVRLQFLDARPDAEAVLHLQLHDVFVGQVLDAHRSLAGARQMKDHAALRRDHLLRGAREQAPEGPAWDALAHGPSGGHEAPLPSR